MMSDNEVIQSVEDFLQAQGKPLSCRNDEISIMMFTEIIEKYNVANVAMFCLLIYYTMLGRPSLSTNLTSFIRIGNQSNPWLTTASGERQGCVIAADFFATSMDWLLERSVGRGMNGTSFGQY